MKIADLLETKYHQYNTSAFLEEDPVTIPHLFSKKQDIEITGFFAAILAWGQRNTIINKCRELIRMMDGAPYDFIMNHKDTDLKPFADFKHRTFNGTDALYFIAFFRHHYQQHDTLEDAFFRFMHQDDATTENGIAGFHHYFFRLEEYPARTMKHIASPEKKSACKRINMFLRWMVRKDNRGVDFGIWHNINPNQLVCPCDIHVGRVARKLNLISRKQTDWQSALELTANLKKLDHKDPVKYDFALFGLGVAEKF